jgi:pSer/pThr/pTyr-binding forkhead associated (FHA) protein
VDVKLTVQCEVDGAPRSYDLEFQQDLITIGRHSRNDVQIPDMQVSAEHARIMIEEDDAYLIDLGSGLGTLLDGEEVDSHKRIRLRDEAELTIGGYLVVVGKPRDKLDDTSTEKTAMVAMKMVKEVLGSLTGGDEEIPFLEIVTDEGAGAKLDIAEDGREYRIGREKACDLILKHWSISRKHAMVRKSMGTVTLMDVGSKNGVLLNGNRLDAHESRKLTEGDLISIGNTDLKFRDPSSSLLDSMDDSPTPITDLKDLGLDLETKSGPVSPPKETEPRRAETPKTRKAPTTTSAADDTPPPRRRKSAQDSSFADYLPLIVGAVLIIGAIVAAIWLLFLKK